MKAIRRTPQLKRDVTRLLRQGRDMDKLRAALEMLLKGERLSARYRDHVLVGQYRGTREYHIEPDWLLIYELGDEDIVLIRTGSHADLFT